ncbi:MAG: VWA domain-containing protein [Proteobacteria bacterium]|nr:VWA domain-containing protein [Pseudomonadota bacterium]
MKIIVSVLILMFLIAMQFSGCTDSHLYGKGSEDPSANRLGLTGRVCTDDPREAGFPVRVIFLVDTAMGPIFSSFDPEQIRLQALRETLAVHEGNDAFSFAVIGFGARPELLAPEEGYFTRNPGELENAVSVLALPRGCAGEVCRDYSESLSLAHSLIEGDLTNMKAGERSRTQYAVVFMVGGPPSPLSCEHECCELWNVEDCDDSNCVPSPSCTASLLKEEVAELRDDVERKGASSLSFHVLFLAASDTPEDEGRNEELSQTEGFLEEMAFAGAGRFERFNSADTITLDRIGLTRLHSLFEAKSLLVTNMSVLPGLDDPTVDSDRDGLGDLFEQETLKTDHLSPDSDGDGIGDMVETLIWFDPLKREDKPASCSDIDGPPYTDSDGDHLNECEELLIGTDPSLPDTDGDAVTDWVEVVLGTDYLRSDTLSDSDGDGVFNGNEVMEHTDPRSSDVASHLGNAYRYEVTDNGLTKEPSISSPRRLHGITILSAGSDTSGGLGTIRYSPGLPPTLTWQDPQDSTPGRLQKITKAGQYQIPSSAMENSEMERWISIEVDPTLLPPTPVEELLLVELSERHCLSFTVRNIRLLETAALSDEGGLNDVFIYFAEAPKGRLTLPGIFRVAHIPVEYHPETGRVPSDLLIEVNDEEFAAIGY